MARQALPILGAAIGFVVSGFNPMGAQIGFAAGSIVGNIVDPLVVQGPKIGENAVQAALEGGPRSIVIGKGPVSSTCVLARGNRQIKKHRERASKGGGPVTVTERVYWTFAIGLGEPLAAILRIWEDEKLVYDVTPGSAIPAESAKYAERFRFYTGAEDQLPDPDLEVIFGIDSTPYHRGTSYVVFPNYDLTDRRESPPNFRFECASVAVVTRSVWNPDDTGTYGVLLNDGSTLTVANGAGNRRPAARSNASVTGGKWYWEYKIDRLNGQVGVGWGNDSFSLNVDGEFGESDFSWGWNPQGYIKRNATTIGPNPFGNYWAPEFEEGDTLMIALDLDDNKVYVGVNGVFSKQNMSGVVISNPVTGSNSLDWVTNFPNSEIFNDFAPIFACANVRKVDGAGDDQSKVTIRTQIGDFEYPVPGGFEPLGGDSVIEDGMPVPLSAIVSKLHGYAKQDGSKYSASELTDMVAGVVFAGSYTVADAIRSVISPYFADAADYDKKIRYVKRGKPVVRTLTYDDLVDEPEESKRENAAEYPRKVNMMYASPSVGYAPAKATSSRSSPEIKVVGEVEVQIPVVIESPDEAAQIVDKMHKTIWAEADGDIDLHVTDEHLDLVATDCVGIALRGIVRRGRLVQSEDDPGQRKFKFRSDRQSAVTSNVTGIPLPAVTPPRPSIISETALGIIDVSGLWDGDDDLNYYAAMSGMNETWAGSVLQRSLDDGATFSGASGTDLNAIIGVLQAGISDASEHYTDTSNVVLVQLYMRDDIDSLTNQQFLSEQGAFAIRRPDGSWELMQYRDADDLGDGLYELTTLHRGRLNSGTSAHLAGAMFVLLDSAVVKVPAGSGWIGSDFTHRAVSNGLSPETADEQTQEYVGRSQIEWPVAHVILERDGDDVAVTVIPRHRFGTEDRPVPSGSWRGFRIIATDGSNINTLDTNSSTSIIDVTGWASPVTVSVSQINLITGAGPAVSESIA